MATRQQSMFVGDEYFSNRFGVFKVIAYHGCNAVDVQFSDGTIVQSTTGNIRSGRVRNPNHRMLYNVGYIGVGDYRPSLNSVNTREYNTWNNMFDRVYSETEIRKDPRRLHSKVWEGWHCYQDFAAWCNKQPSWEKYSWALDKDLLVKGNVDYTPEVCCFIPNRLNTIISKPFISENIHMLSDGYAVQSRDMAGKNRLLRGFKSKDQLIDTCKTQKESIVRAIASEYKNYFPERVYQTLMAWELEVA